MDLMMATAAQIGAGIIIVAELNRRMANNLVLLVTLDVKNPFNSIRRGEILKELVRREVAPYLIQNRFLKRRMNCMEVQAGVPRGLSWGHCCGMSLMTEF